MHQRILTYATACLLATLLASASMAAQGAPSYVKPTGIKTIVIDPGHGGEDNGATGPGGTKEKTVNLAVAKVLKTKLKEKLPVRIVLTREEDTYLTLERRTEIANEEKADIFISIHANASKNKTVAGAETFFLSLDASDDDARMTAAFENEVVKLDEKKYGKPANDLKSILWDLAQTEAHHESSLLAELVQENISVDMKTENRGVKQAPFVVLFGTTMPAILVEVGFISNPAEEKRIKDATNIDKIAESISKGVERFNSRLTKQEKTTGAQKVSDASK